MTQGDRRAGLARIKVVRWLFAIALTTLALSLPASVEAKGFTRLIVIGADQRWLEVRAKETVITDWARAGARPRSLEGGYLRLFFVGPGDFPANPGRYYPALGCFALDWPRYQRSCVVVNPALAGLLRRARGLPRFQARPTVLGRISYLGERTFSRFITGPGALTNPVELALDRTPKPVSSRPRGCFELAGSWTGPAARLRPLRFSLCPSGVYADGRLHPLARGVWAWFDLNLGPTKRRPAQVNIAGHARQTHAVPLTRQIPPLVQRTCKQLAAHTEIGVVCPPLVPRSRIVPISGLYGFTSASEVRTPRPAPSSFWSMSFNNGGPFGTIHWIVAKGTPKAVQHWVLSDSLHEVKGLPRPAGVIHVHGLSATIYRFPDYPAGAEYGGHFAAVVRRGSYLYVASIHGRKDARASALMAAEMAIADR